MKSKTIFVLPGAKQKEIEEFVAHLQNNSPAIFTNLDVEVYRLTDSGLFRVGVSLEKVFCEEFAEFRKKMGEKK